MHICALAEDKIPGTKVVFQYWNKNKALAEENDKSVDNTNPLKEEIKVDNRDNHIEQQAKVQEEAKKQQQEQSETFEQKPKEEENQK